MDAARKKALFRAKLNAQKKDKRIDSPLVRYNEFDQPVCRICNVVLKSESLWDAHQASRKHHEAINNIKSNAAGHVHVNNVKADAHAESAKLKHAPNAELHSSGSELTTKSLKPQSSSLLPSDFFDNDNHEAKKKNSGAKDVKLLDSDSYKRAGASGQIKAMESVLENEMDGLASGNDVQAKYPERSGEFIHSPASISGMEAKQVKGALPEGFFDDKETDLGARGIKPIKQDVKRPFSDHITSTEAKQVKGALPEGFFDNKEADLRARGIKLVKADAKDEYKEFEKLIQEDLQEVDNRMEEEEIDAAEMIEEAESLEQKACRERVELLRKMKTELTASRSAKRKRGSDIAGNQSSHEESSSDDDEDENFAVDWRAQHL